MTGIEPQYYPDISAQSCPIVALKSNNRALLLLYAKVTMANSYHKCGSLMLKLICHFRVGNDPRINAFYATILLVKLH